MILSLEFDKNKNWNMITQPVKDYFLSMKGKYKGDLSKLIICISNDHEDISLKLHRKLFESEQIQLFRDFCF